MGLLVAGIQADHHGESADRELFSGSVISHVATCTGQRDVSAGGVVRVRLRQGRQQNAGALQVLGGVGGPVELNQGVGEIDQRQALGPLPSEVPQDLDDVQEAVLGRLWVPGGYVQEG